MTKKFWKYQEQGSPFMSKGNTGPLPGGKELTVEGEGRVREFQQ